MAKGGNIIDIRTDHAGAANLDYVKSMDKRGPAFKRAYNWALANDLHGMIKDGIPRGQSGTLAKSLKLGETVGPKGSAFSVYIDSQSKHIKKMDSQRTVIYVRRRGIPTRTKPEIQLLIDKGPWTTDTMPFWPSKKDALIIQRKTDSRTAQKIDKLQQAQKDSIRRELSKINVKGVDDAVKRKTMGGRRAKAVSDVAYEMLTLEFGGGKTKASGLWRNSIKKLPSMQKTLLGRHRRIERLLYDPRYKSYSGYPRVGGKVKMSQLNNSRGFVKQVNG